MAEAVRDFVSTRYAREQHLAG